MAPFNNHIVTTCASCNSTYKVSVTLIGKPVKCTNCKVNFIVENPNKKKQRDEDESLFICKIALNYGLVNEKQLQTVLTEYTKQTQTGETPVIENLLVSLNIISPDNVVLLKDIRKNWAKRQVEKKFAAEAVNRGIITPEQAREALVKQAIDFKHTRVLRPLGDFISESRISRKTDDYHKGSPLVPKTAAKGEQHPEKQTDTDTNAATIPLNETLSAPAEARQVPKEREQETRDHHTPEPEKKETADTESVPETKPLEEAPEVKTEAEEIPKERGQEPPLTAKPDKKETTDTPLPEAKPSEEAPVPQAKEEPPIARDMSTIDRTDQDSADNSQREIQDETAEPSETIINIKGLELVIPNDRIFAYLRAQDDNREITATLDDIKTVLMDEEIIYGIADDALIKGFLNSKIFREKPFMVAEGKTPKEGSNGNIKYFFETDYLKIGSLDDSGQIDFKDRGEIPHVNEGDLLAEITPAVLGKNGTNIYGQTLTVPVIPEVFLRCEKGTRMSDDQLKIYATTSGQPKLSFGNKITVLSELTIPGDVGFETGHIEFEGNIIVNGTIQSDFTVKGANIKAKEVLAANIQATGDLTVINGITGANINAQGSVKAKFINKGLIKAFGDINVNKEIIDSTIENSGACKIERGKIISSQIASKQGIEALEVGTEMSNPNTLRIGVDDHIANEVNTIKENISEKREKLVELKDKIDTLSEEEKEVQKKIAELAHLQDRSQINQNELKKELEALKPDGANDKIASLEKGIEKLAAQAREADESINEFFDKQDELNDSIAKLREIVEATENQIKVLKDEKSGLMEWAKKLKIKPYVKAKTIFAGTTIIGSHTSKVLKETVRNSRIREVESSSSANGWELKIG